MKAEHIGQAQSAYNQFQNIVKPGKEKEKTAEQLFTSPVDTYTPSLEGVANPERISELLKEFDYVADAVRKLVASAIGRGNASGQSFWAIRADANFSLTDIKNGEFSYSEVNFSFSYTEIRSSEGGYKLSEADRAKAQELIGEDGYFGVKQTSARIMDFAKALVGADASGDRINLMRDAVQKGFDEVAKLFGGFDRLPDVTKKTYETIMQAFDEWFSGASAE